MSKKRIGIVEDNVAFANDLCKLLETRNDCEVVFVAESYESALQLMKKVEFDWLFVDLGLPDGDGADLILKAKRAFPKALSYVLSATDDGDLILNSIKQGAEGFVFKNDSPFVFLDGIYNIFMGAATFSGTVSQAIINHLKVCAVARARISERQFEIMKYLSLGFRPKEISKRLHISVDTINSHIKAVYKALDVNSCAAAINILQL